ncbi:MAG: AAA family ATPase [Candidatus Omnitrophica bacterium]|nr:AAA family ATPase [Candidatus Omnitrophota bacterium]
MGHIIALAGKGGTGKTTTAALIVRIIREKKLGSVLAVDADPNSNLGESLGLAAKESIGTILDEMSKHPDKIPAGMSKDRFLEYRVSTAIMEGEGFDLLTMGKPEGLGCYCYINNVLRNIVDKLIKDYDFVVIDNEAGLEHLSRRTTRHADILLTVSDATKVGLRAAKRVNDLSKELEIKIGKRLLIINKDSGEADKDLIKETGLEHIGNVGIDQALIKISSNGNSITDLPPDALSLKTLVKIGESIWQRN